jgi:DNA-binding MarR family transcriptional regulator
MPATATATKPTTTDRILDLYRDIESATVRDLMTHLGVSKTTVNDNLKKLADAGDVIRMDVDGVATWYLTPTRKAANKRAAAKLAKQAAASKPESFAKRLGKAERGMAEAAGLVPAKTTAKAPRKVAVKVVDTEVAERAADNADAVETHTSKGKTLANGRRPKGRIDAEIINFLRRNEGGHGSYAVANAIGSSKGAAYVALKRMDREGTVTLVSTGPDRYTLA